MNAKTTWVRKEATERKPSKPSNDAFDIWDNELLSEETSKTSELEKREATFNACAGMF